MSRRHRLERDQFLLQHAAGRALNFPLLNAALTALQKREQSLGYAIRRRNLPTQEEITSAIEKLDDEGVAAAYTAVTADRAQRISQAVNSYKTPHEQLQAIQDEFESGA